jgi:hypothetical protein
VSGGCQHCVERVWETKTTLGGDPEAERVFVQFYRLHRTLKLVISFESGLLIA